MKLWLPIHRYVHTSYVYHYFIYDIIAFQFVLLMDLPFMRVEWRCYTMVYGVQCVMMDGI